MIPKSEMQNPISIIRSHSLASLALSEIEKLILSGTLKAGDRIGELEIGQRIGVSRGPIREAFRALEEQGLVRIEKNRGVFVREVTFEEADEAYSVRAAMEGHAASILAQKITPEQLGELKDIVDQMEVARSANDMHAYTDLNLRFHRTLIQFAGNHTLEEIYIKLVKALTLFRMITLLRTETFATSYELHHTIVEAIESGDPEIARKEITSHVEAGRLRMHTTQSQHQNLK